MILRQRFARPWCGAGSDRDGVCVGVGWGEVRVRGLGFLKCKGTARSQRHLF